MDATPLSPEDRAILALENDTVAGHTCKLVLVGQDEFDVAALRASVAARMPAAPQLTRRLRDDPDAPAWVPDGDFDIARHVVDVPADRPLDQAGLRAEVARLFAERLDRSRPLWRIDAAPLEGGGGAIIWRLHHALADGTTAMRFGDAVLWDPLVQPRPTSAPTRAAHAADDERRRAHLLGFVRREFATTLHGSPFDGRIGTRRAVALARVPLHELHDAAKAICGATLNDGVLCVVAGALRRWIQLHHGHLGTTRIKVPVSLHHEGDDAGNRDSYFCVGVPLGESDSAARLRAVQAATAVRKADHDAETMDELLRGLSRISPSLERFCAQLELSPRQFAVTVSNVVGPRAPVAVLGAPVEELYSIAEIRERHALRVGVVSLCDSLYFGFCADPAIVDDVQSLADAVEAEAEALLAAA